jgi:hypothetical protein
LIWVLSPQRLFQVTNMVLMHLSKSAFNTL